MLTGYKLQVKVLFSREELGYRFTELLLSSHNRPIPKLLFNKYGK